MLKLIHYFFTALGVIFFCLILGAAYLWFADPWNLRPLVSAFVSPQLKSQMPRSIDRGDRPQAPAYLSDQQVMMLETAGIDTSALPSTISPETEACLVGVVGDERAAEIRGGSAPSARELFEARACLE